MKHETTQQSDYGTGQKKLGIYIIGIISCAVLTLISFWAVMASHYPRGQVFTIIYVSACVQFLVQLVCFLRLNTETEPGRINVMAIVFTLVILTSIIIGSLWIMANLNYNMMN